MFEFSFSTLIQEARDNKDKWMQAILARDILSSTSLDEAVAELLARKLTDYKDDYEIVRQIVSDTWDDALLKVFRLDIETIRRKDPACKNWLTPFLNFKGFHALQAHRVAHELWKKGERDTATWLQGLVSKSLSVDIHPGAQFGTGILIDHATGLVVGETAIVEDDVTLFHLVTLGGNGKQTGERHPIIRKGAKLYAGAKVIGRIEVGENAIVGASANVLSDVPANTTVVGNPARPVKKK